MVNGVCKVTFNLCGEQRFRWETNCS